MTTSGWWVAMRASRWVRAIRARNVTSARVAGVGTVEVLEDDHDRLVLAEAPKQPEDPLEGPGLASFGGGHDRLAAGSMSAASSRAPSSGSSRSASARRRPDDAARTSAAARRGVGPIARISGPYGSSSPPGQAPAAQQGQRLGQAGRRGRMASSSRRVTPTPAEPPMSIERARPFAASSRADARRANASSRPTNRALVYLAGMRAF